MRLININIRSLILSLFISLLTGFGAAQAAGPTYVGGDVTVYTKWTTQDSPYIVTGNLTVKSGGTLEIEPGVTVEFSAGKSLSVNYNGAITAVGSPASLITFTSSIENPGAGYWNQIYFDAQTPTKSSFRYCIIENAANGLYLSGSTVRIKDCILRNNFHGVALNNSPASLEGNTISSNESGIYFDSYSANVNINGNSVRNNLWGIYCREHSTATISGNDIISNEVGIQVSGGSNLYIYQNNIFYDIVGVSVEGALSAVSKAQISYNRFRMNRLRLYTASYGNSAISLGPYPDVTINNNIITLEGTGSAYLAGIYMSATASLQKIVMSFNEINTIDPAGPVHFGVYMVGAVQRSLKMNDNIFRRAMIMGGWTFTDDSFMQGNTISGEGTGTGIDIIELPQFMFNKLTGWVIAVNMSSGSGLHYNDLSSNVTALSSGNLIDARWNWWGASDGPGYVGPSLTGSKVNDKVIYDPWLSAPVSSASAETISSLRIYRKAGYSGELNPSDDVGIFDRVFISAEASTESPSEVNWLSILITTEVYRPGMNLYLIETASNSGVYNGFVRLNNGGSSSAIFNLISAEVGNKVRINTPIDPSKTAVVNVGRTARWIADNSPELFPNTLDNYYYFTLPSGSTLEIYPGVTIKSMGAGLRFKGRVIATGESASRITFTSAKTVPSMQDWNGIYLESGASGSVFRYCDIKYGSRGIFAIGTSAATIENCRFSDIVYHVANDGAAVNASTNSTLDILNNTFDNCTFGVICRSSKANILGNLFESNGTYGKESAVYCYDASTSTIKGNTFSHNLQGIYCESAAPIVKFNNFLGNTDYGVFNGTSSTPFSALYSWWGTSEGADLTDTRPFPPFPGGTSPGDNVSAYVYFEPFLTEGPAGYYLPSSINSANLGGGNAILERMFLTVRGVDLSAESVNWTTVKITSESDPSGITMDLIETGLNSGTFEGESRLVAGPSSSDHALINVQLNKKLTVSSVQSPEINAVKTVQGLGTWEAAKSPEILARNTVFLLPASSKLVIKPGVTVEMDDSSGLLISGELYASGEPSSRISFTSRRKYPSAGNWQYIKLIGANSTPSVIRNCDISYGDFNLWLDSSSPVVTGNRIKYGNSYGIYSYNNTAPILGNVIDQNPGRGIFIQACRAVIRGNVITNNGRAGSLYAGLYNYGNYEITIEGNYIASNEPYGIYSESVWSTWIRGNTIEAGPNSTVRYCIYCYMNRDPLIRFNNLVGYNSDDYGVYYVQANSLAVDASYNYWANARVGNFVISTPSVEGPMAYAPPSSVGAVKLYKDKNFTALTSGLGILDRVFISAEGTDADINHYNWTTVILSNETTPSSVISVDLVERGANNSGVFGGEARIGSTNNDDYVDMIGSAVGNTLKAYSLVGSAVSPPLTVLFVATWEAADSPERILNYSTLTLPTNSILRVEPGVRVEAGNNAQIYVYGSLEARGQKTNRILFTAANPNPSAGSWRDITFNSGNKGLIAYSKVEYGGYYDACGVYIFQSSPLLAMVSVESCSTSGVMLQLTSPSFSPKVVDCDFSNNLSGVRGFSTAYVGSAKVNYNNLFSGGVSNESSSVTLEARNNWWNSPSGPNPASKVYGKVNYIPYLPSINVPGGPIASNARPSSGEALRDMNVPIRVNLFDPEDVNLSTVSVEMNGVTYTWPTGLSYESSTNDLFFTHEALSEGLNTFEVVAARDIFDETLRYPLVTSFYIDLTLPEITGVSVFPHYAKAGNVLVTVEAEDVPSGIDHSVTPEVRVRHGGGLSGRASQLSYTGGIWKGTLTILATFENGPATIEAGGVTDKAGNVCDASLEAAQIFVDTVAPTVEVFSPVSGVTLEGPTNYYISWEAYDITPESGLSGNPVSIYLVHNYIQTLITSEMPNASPYRWAIPPLTVDNCTIRVDVRDRAGNVGHGTSGVFNIHTINPYILSTAPSDEETYVPVLSTIDILFNKPMSTETVENAFSMNPFISGTFEWADGDARAIYHPDQILDFFTTYEVTIDWGPTDKLGHSLLGVPHVLNFITVPSESGKPTISHVRFDGRGYREDDIITSTPRITAVILDSPEAETSGVSLSDIAIKLGSYVTHPDTYSISGEMEVQLGTFPLGAGTYIVSIEAHDRAGNAAEPFTGRVRVIYGDVKIVGQPTSYPTPFKPLSGERATIAYTLTKDADITIYMYDVSSRMVLTKKFVSGSNGGRAGYNSFDWSGKTQFGRLIGNGIYVYKIISGKRTLATGKLVVYD